MTPLAPNPDRGRSDPAIRTFLIADIRGYTRFTSDHGDAAAARLARHFADIVADGVRAGAGDLVELRGDEALAAFSSARQAIRTAVELQAVLVAESGDPSLPLGVGIGLDAGEAVPVDGGFRGAALNRAARLCSQAGPGEVLASEGVVHLAGPVDGIEFVRRDPLELKGLLEPVVPVLIRPREPRPVARTRSERQATPMAASVSGDLAPDGPLLGRDADLAWLAWAWRLATLGFDRLAIVVGERGMGKTRLVAELAGRANEAGGSLRSLAGRGAGGAVDPRSFEAADEGATELVVVDDFDALDPAAADAVAGWASLPSAGGRFVVLTVSDLRAPAMARVLDRLDPDGDRRRQLGPLGGDSVRALAAAEVRDIDETELAAVIAEGSGLPRRIQAAIDEVLTRRAVARLEVSVGETAAVRDRLRSTELSVVDEVSGLQGLRAHARRFVFDDVETMIPEAGGTCPYKGLAPFDSSDADFFFGRERLIAELVARLVGATLLGVVGPSGSGKSSAVRAGLLPALASGVIPGSGHWRQVLLRPGEHPLAELHRALGDAAPTVAPSSDSPSQLATAERRLDEAVETLPATARLLLAVDQFEEVFTAVEAEEERSAFIDLLTACARRPDGRIVVVLAIRADLYGRCATYPRLSRVLAASQVLVGPLTADELRRTIELPARVAGLRVESALVDALVGEVVSEPGGLPLLSTTLLELWQRRDGRTMRLVAFQQMGGVKGSVARLAESAYQRLDIAQQRLARGLLLRLAGPGEGDAVVRRRAPLAELEADRDADAAAVLDTLTRNRLVTVDEGSVEVAHEALLREWPRLVGWLEEDAQGRQLHRHLTLAAQEWDAAGREPAELYRGARLATTADWAVGHADELNQLERGFLEESRSASELEAVRQRRANRRLRLLLIGMLALLVVVVAAGGFAIVQGQAAQRSATTAQAQRLGAQALVEPQLDRALLLAAEGQRLDPSEITRSNLIGALLRAPAATRVIRVTGAPVQAVALSPDGHLLAIADENGVLAFVDPATGSEVRPRLTLDAPVADVVFSPDGATLAVSLGSEVRLVDAGSGTVRATGSIGSGVNLGDLAYAPDGSFILGVVNRPPASDGSGSGRVERFDGSTGQLEAMLLEFDETQLSHVAVLPDGKHFIVAAARGGLPPNDKDGISLFDVDTGYDSKVGYSDGGLFALSPTGKTLAVADPSGGVGIVGVDGQRAGELFPNLSTPQRDVIRGLAFSPDGRTLALASADRTVTTWDVTEDPSGPPIAALRETFAGHAATVLRPVFSPDSSTLYTPSADGSVIAWDLADRGRLGRSFVEPGNPDGRAIAATSVPTRELLTVERDQLVRTWDASSLKPALIALSGAGAVSAVAAATDAPVAVVARGPNLATYDLAQPQRSGAPTGPPITLGTGSGAIEAVDLTSDGRTVVASYRTDTSDELVRVDLTTRTATTLRTDLAVSSLDLAPDDRTLVVGQGSGATDVLDLASGRTLRSLPAAASPVTVVRVSPDGSRVAIGSATGLTMLVDLATGRAVGPAPTVPTGSAISLAFSPDGHLLAIGSSDGRATLYDASTGHQVVSYPAGAGQITRSSRFDSLGNFDGGGTTVGPSAVVFSPDGSDLIVVHVDGRDTAWPIDPDRLTARACAVAGRELSADEWVAAVPDRPYADVCPGSRAAAGAAPPSVTP